MVNPDELEPVCDISDAQVIGADAYLETYLDHPEGVCVARDGRLYSSGEDGQVYLIDPESNEVDELADTGGFTLGVTLDSSEEHLYICDFQKHAVFKLPLAADGTAGGELEIIASGTKQDPPIQPNFNLLDSDGRLYYSDSGDRTAPMDDSGGSVRVIDTDGTEEVLTEQLSGFTNGLALSKDESTLYVAETGHQRISAVHLDGATEVESIETVTEEFGHVDGIALDAEDRLYAASIGDDAIYRQRDGEPELVLHDPNGLLVGNPTNLAFGGDDMRTAYVANLGLTHITAIELDLPGRLPTARL